MRKIEEIKLSDLVKEQESAVMLEKRDRIGMLIKEKIKNRERIKEQILFFRDELERIESEIENLKKEDWTIIDWKDDSAEG